MTIRLYNTLSRKKEIFRPIRKGEVGMYCCGPTVYNHAHIGNLRAYVFNDLLRRTFEYNGLKVKHVVNITDVGHLTSDADEGEDKMMKALIREGLPPTEESMLKIAEKFTVSFKSDLQKLNILKPDIWPKATEHIQDMIKLIRRIESNGFTYKTKIGLIFDTSKFKAYAKLGRLKLEDLKAGARVKIDPERKNPSDFSLWVVNQPNHIMQWDSPWGRGFPGWHIECSAMSMKYLGENFDVHCGGIDHIPIHHTNEIAQSEAATGKKWVNYWVHNDFLVMKKSKMSKSKGGFLTLQALIDEGFEPLDYRYFCLGAHYKTQLIFSFEALKSARNALNRLKENVIMLKDNPCSFPDKKIENKYEKEFLKNINNDLNTPKALALMLSVIKDKKLGNKEKLGLLLDFDKVLGLGIKEIKREELDVPLEIKKLLDDREEARKAKDWDKSDKIRIEIEKKGFLIDDSPDGPILKKNVRIQIITTSK